MNKIILFLIFGILISGCQVYSEYTLEYSEGSCDNNADCVYAGEGCGGGHGICTNQPEKYEGRFTTCEIVPEHPINNNYSCVCITSLKNCGWVK